MVAKWAWLVLVVVACSNTSPAQPSPPDAAPAPGVCEGRAYDPCNDASGCPLVESAACEPIDGTAGADKVCTVACTGSDFVCPLDGVGNAGTCVNGFCFADRGLCTPR